MENNILHRKDSLIITTIEIIDELGIQGLSTREIAKRQGVSEGTLFRHYKSKNELLVSVIDFFVQFDNDIYQSSLLMNSKPNESLIYYINSHIEYYENYPSITVIMQMMDVLKSYNDLKDKVIEVFNIRNKQLNQLIINAQAEEVITSKVDSAILVNIIWGFCREICLEWRLTGQNFSLHKRVMASLEAFLNAFKSAT